MENVKRRLTAIAGEELDISDNALKFFTYNTLATYTSLSGEPETKLA